MSTRFPTRTGNAFADPAVTAVLESLQWADASRLTIAAALTQAGTCAPSGRRWTPKSVQQLLTAHVTSDGASQVTPRSLALFRHDVHVYRDDTDLVQRVSIYLARALHRGATCLVIATVEHRSLVRRALEDLGLTDGLQVPRYIEQDADELLATFMRNGVPVAELFDQVVQPFLSSAAPGAPPLHGYGEMVDILWRAGDVSGAMQLEDLWNDLQRRTGFELLCAYAADGVYGAAGAAVGVGGLRARHSHVTGATGPQTRERPDGGDVTVHVIPDHPMEVEDHLRAARTAPESSANQQRTSMIPQRDYTPHEVEVLEAPGNNAHEQYAVTDVIRPSAVLPELAARAVLAESFVYTTATDPIIGVDNPQRLRAVAEAELRGHLGDPDLDAVVGTLRVACGVPIAVINIVTSNLQTYPAEVGVGAPCTEVPNGLSFCAEVVDTGLALTVANAAQHPVYARNPMVLAGVIGAYAGCPLVHDGAVLGSVSIFDGEAREFSTEVLAILEYQTRLAASVLALRRKARTDVLTGLPNRERLLDRLGSAIARLDRNPGLACVLYFDVDDFKQINDAHGHAAGDDVLVELGHRLLAVLRPTDTVSRFGGDEFVAVCEDLRSVDDTERLVGRIVRAITPDWCINGQWLTVNVSIGCALTASPATQPTMLLHDADEAMYQAKQLAGTNSVMSAFRVAGPPRQRTA